MIPIILNDILPRFLGWKKPHTWHRCLQPMCPPTRVERKFPTRVFLTRWQLQSRFPRFFPEKKTEEDQIQQHLKCLNGISMWYSLSIIYNYVVFWCMNIYTYTIWWTSWTIRSHAFNIIHLCPKKYPPEVYMAPEKFPSQKESSLPTNHFQGLC